MNEQDKGHGHWSAIRVNGVGTDFLKSNLFIFLLGQGIMFSFWLVGFTTTYGRKEEQWQQMATWRAGMDATIKRMDDKGTNASHWAIDKERESILANSKKIEELQSQTRKLDVMDEKLSRMQTDLNELKSRK